MFDPTMQLGFGMMRLPLQNGEIDIDHVNRMVDLYMERGYRYFDTAYFYHDSKSEGVMKTCVVDRKPRESVLLADKMPLYSVKETADCEKFFTEQLRRTGAGYFDYYMMHALSAKYEEAVRKFGVWFYIRQLKKQGLIRKAGFSFHDKPEVLEKYLSTLKDVDFVQLQINYLDWDCPNNRAREMYEIARRHGVEIIVMEPVRGGSLATLSTPAQKMLKSACSSDSVASWAIRFCASLDGVSSVLSGMSSIAQVEDNSRTMNNIQPLSEDEFALLDRVATVIRATPTIGCTRCKYCIEECPQKIEIDRAIGLVNHVKRYGSTAGSWGAEGLIEQAKKCIECELCQPRCPQNIDIIKALKELVK
ncbi:MAG: aldo/keto reductase [Oscillospiraceae bacterium]|nr:aldo/keto reductase [Oscillospiraceae bacterium]